MQHWEVQIIHWINIKDRENSVDRASHKEHHQTHINDPVELAKKTVISPALYEKGSSVQEVNWIS